LNKFTGNAKGLTDQLLTFSKGGEPVKKVIAIDHLFKGSGKVLVMDDDKSIRDVAGMMLTELGFTPPLCRKRSGNNPCVQKSFRQ